MNNIAFKSLPQITGGTLVQGPFDHEIHDLIIDSRKANPTENSIFFAINGIHHDGHEFIGELYEKGCRQFVIESEIDLSLFQEASFLLVASSLNALQRLVAKKRSEFSLPVIAVTGSNGKTIVKEWLSQLLSADRKLIKNPASYNSQIGVPLSVWPINASHELGIFEAGISRKGEMESLARIISPTLGILTNVLSAHDEGFESREGKAAEKAKLFVNASTVVYCKDHDLVDQVLQRQRPKNQTLFSWGCVEGANVRIVRMGDHSRQIYYQSNSVTISKKFADAASWENLSHCIATMIHLGYRLDEIPARLEIIKSLPMRLELKAGVNGSTIIDDSYSNDLAGLSVALDFFDSQRSGKGVLFLSDMIESGLDEEAWLQKINNLLIQHSIDRLIAVGPVLKKNINSVTIPSRVYESVEECLKNFPVSEISHATVLIKGARSFQFEQLVQQFQRKVHGTVMEINLNSIVHNLNVFRSRLKPETKIMAMVKAFAYGSGSNEIASVLQYHKVDYLGVAYADEGKWLRSKGIQLPIMVMNPSEEIFSTIVAQHLEPSIYSIPLLRSLVDHLQGTEIFIHVKLDTGMHRLGFEDSDIDELKLILNKNANVKIKSVYSHLAGSDEASHDTFTSQQVERFKKMCDNLSEIADYPILKHILNTAGITRLGQYQFDMVRLGIGLYGIDPGNEITNELNHAVTLRTTISQIKSIKKGETIGYGRHGKSERDIKVATLSIGYADGFSRAFSNGVGKVLIKNKRAPVIGNVCMDMTMVDVTGIDADENEEAIIFGPELPITEVATWIETIPYEILTNTSDRVRRIFFAESV